MNDSAILQRTEILLDKKKKKIDLRHGEIIGLISSEIVSEKKVLNNNKEVR